VPAGHSFCFFVSKIGRMQGALVQASCGHRLERSDQGAGRLCGGCYASCPDSGATQWFRCTEGGCEFDLCGSCHANGYPSAGHLRPVVFRWSVEHTSAAFWSVQPCPMHSAAQRGASGRRGGRESAAGGGL
jgi:hypothetical protein